MFLNSLPTSVVIYAVTSFPPLSSFPPPLAARTRLKLGPRCLKCPHGQKSHVTHIRLSDWLKFEILRSDWLAPYSPIVLLAKSSLTETLYCLNSSSKKWTTLSLKQDMFRPFNHHLQLRIHLKAGLNFKTSNVI